MKRERYNLLITDIKHIHYISLPLHVIIPKYIYINIKSKYIDSEKLKYEKNIYMNIINQQWIYQIT